MKPAYAMYDTITLFVNALDIPGTDFMAELPLRITGVNEVYDYHRGFYKVRGTLNKFMHATVSPAGILITGSICKYYHGDNQHTLTLSEVRAAFDRLFGELVLPVACARVYRVDIADNYLVHETPAVYYPYLGYAHYFVRSDMGTTLYYKNGNRQMIFYDKISEQENKGVTICEGLAGKNVLRYEYRIRKNLAERLGIAFVTPLDLSDPMFYKVLLEEYLKQYLSIEKYNLISFAPEVMKDSKSFISQLALLGIQTLGGQSIINDILLRARQQGAFSSAMAYKRMKDKVKYLCNIPELTQRADYIKELDAKITGRVVEEIAGI